MTIEKLSQLQHLDREIRLLRSQIQRLREQRRAFVVTDSVQASSKCEPYQLHSQLVRGVGPSAQAQALSETIAQRKSQLAETLLKREQELLEAELYIAGIPDSLTRQIFTLRFVEGYSWQQVAVKVGGGNTEVGVKQLCSRYLRK